MLARLRIVLFLLIGAGIALAALCGRIRRSDDRPDRRSADAAEHISETEDLSRRIEVSSEDEVGRLAARFNSMLATLDAARSAAQRQLVADASHELRTPVTSLRTNIEVMRERAWRRTSERRELLAEVRAQIVELGALIADVIELARGDDGRGAGRCGWTRSPPRRCERMRGMRPRARSSLARAGRWCGAPPTGSRGRSTT